MTRSALTLTAAALAAAANGCSGFSDTPTSPADAQRTEFRQLSRVTTNWSAHERPAPTVPVMSTTPDPPKSKPPEPTMMPVIMKPKPAQMEPTIDVDADANIRLAQSDAFDGYLTDGAGRALYMFIGDVAASRESACLGTCADDWPPFDVQEPKPALAIGADAIARYHRQDGAWQITYHGHPLYYRASESNTHDVSGDGVDERWFVARNYLAFMGSSRTFTPAGGDSPMGTFLTDGFGRTLYVCLDDEPGTATTEAITTCDQECTLTRPIFDASETSHTTLLPSVLPANAWSDLVRLDGSLQLTYRGWPLYYFTGDIVAGSTEGHNDQAWRAFDPIRFGTDLTADPAP